ncbi:MAG: hypothetical protein KF812_09965 [Fimbriimonadaceae bacterium]|nr:hypothetical protein [Fimbriimonadaceae bacterium]
MKRALPFLVVGFIVLVFGLAFWFATRASFKTNDPLYERRVSDVVTPNRVNAQALALHNDFAFRVLEALEGEEPMIVPTAALTRVLTAFLNGSEDPTYTKLATNLGIGDQGESDFNSLQRLILDAENESGDVREGAAIWFVWPYMPGPGYIREMSDTLEVDVFKLGSARLGAKKTVASWAERREPGLTSPHDSFTDLDIIMANGFLALSGAPELRTTKTTGLFAAEGPSWDLYWVDGMEGREETVRLLKGAVKAPPELIRAGPEWRPPTGSEQSRELSKVLARIDLGFLKEDNDFRGISPELTRRSAVTRIATQVLWNDLKPGRTPIEARGRFVIVEPKTRAIIAVGKD